MRWPLLLLAGCAHHAAHMILQVESPAVAASPRAPIDLVIDAPATSYNQRVDAPTTPERDALWAEIQALAHEKGDPRRDGRLDRVAGDLAALPDPTYAPAVEVALRARGVIEPANRVLVGRSLADLDFATSLFFANVRIGVGGGGAQPFVVVVVHTALVELPELPRVMAAGEKLDLHGVLDPRLHEPAVTVAYEDDPDAVAHPVIWKRDRYTFDTAAECGAHTGAMWILIEGTEEDKPQVQHLALFPVGCVTPPDDAYRIEPRLPIGDPIPQLAAVIDRERARLHLRPLAGDLRATRAAQREVAIMRRDHSVAHGDTARRLRDAGLLPPTLLEATLHAPDATAAAEILMNTRGYRELLARPELTHVGIAYARDERGELYLALELVQIVDPVDTARMKRELFARVIAQLGNRERPIVKTNTTLDHLAEHYTSLRAVGWDDASAYYGFTDDGDLDFGPFKNLHRVIALQLDDNTTKLELDIPPRIDAFGISVVQSPRNGALAGRVWVIVLYGRSRAW